MSQHDNRVQNQKQMDVAIERAQQTLKVQGITFPQYDSALTAEENYDRVTSYRTKESNLIAKYISEQANPRPLVEPVALNKHYKDWMDD